MTALLAAISEASNGGQPSAPIGAALKSFYMQLPDREPGAVRGMLCRDTTPTPS